MPSNVFSAAIRNNFSRNFGGTNVGVADPYLTGYFFVHFRSTQVFGQIANIIKEDGVINISEGEIPLILQACCTGVTPPGGTLASVDFPGLGGTKWGVPGNIDYGNTISLKFIELQGLPIYHVIHNWFKLIRDYRFGATTLEEGDQRTGYSKSKYACDLYYWTTAPDAQTVEFAVCYDGLYPTKDPQDLYSSDLETVGRLDVEIEFHLDYPWTESWVYDKCRNLATEVNQVRTQIENRYGDHG